jgi:hypothetical protein
MIALILILSVPLSIVALIIWDAEHFERRSQRSDIRTSIGPVAVVSVVAAILSALFAGSSFVFSNLYQPEDLVVSARVLSPMDQIGTNRIDVSLVFTNAAKQPIVIENILLAEDYGKTTRIETNNDWRMTSSIWIRDIVSRPDGQVENMQDGTHFVVFSPIKTRINNIDSPSPSGVISAGSASIFTLSFAPTPIDIETEIDILPMVAIQYYDKSGAMRRKVIPLGFLDWIQFGRRYSPAPGSMRLLPY